MASRRESSGASASVKRADQRYMGRSSPPHDVQFVGARGSYVQGADGRRRLQRSYRATGGTEAVEIALQLAMASTGRSKFVSIEDNYHGNSLGTMSAIGLEFEDGAYAGALADRCRKAGLLLGIDDDTLTLFPALTISRRTVHEGLDILERCL